MKTLCEVFMNERKKNPAAVSLGRLGGKAGTGAAKRRTHEQAQAAGRASAAARWGERIGALNALYAAAIDAGLQPEHPAMTEARRIINQATASVAKTAPPSPA